MDGVVLVVWDRAQRCVWRVCEAYDGKAAPQEDGRMCTIMHTHSASNPDLLAWAKPTHKNERAVQTHTKQHNNRTHTKHSFFLFFTLVLASCFVVPLLFPLAHIVPSFLLYTRAPASSPPHCTPTTQPTFPNLHPKHAKPRRLRLFLHRQGQRKAQHRAGVLRANDPIVPQPGGGVVAGRFFGVLIENGGLEFRLCVGRTVGGWVGGWVGWRRRRRFE